MFGFVALVDEGQPEGGRDIAKDSEVLRPTNNGARRHHRRQVTGRKTITSEPRHGDHLIDNYRVGIRHLSEDDRRLFLRTQIVEGGHHVEAVDLRLIQYLRAVVQPGQVAKAHGVRRCEESERFVWSNYAVLVEQRQPSVFFQHSLDNEHDVGATGIELIEDQRDGVLQRPWQHAFDELGDLGTVSNHDRVAADQVHPADVPIEIYSHRRPIQPSGDLFDMR